MRRTATGWTATPPPLRSRCGSCCAGHVRRFHLPPSLWSGTWTFPRSRSSSATWKSPTRSCARESMPLQLLQAVLARLYLDSGYRARFFADREAALREEPLSNTERGQLLQLDRDQVER